jgi:hypothetical protein
VEKRGDAEVHHHAFIFISQRSGGQYAVSELSKRIHAFLVLPGL